MKTLLFIICLIASPAFARFGETEAQCEARYGKPIERDDAASLVRYFKAPFKISVHFTEGVGDTVLYQEHVRENDPDSPRAVLSDKMIQSILTLYSKQWTPRKSNDERSQAWDAHVGDFVALYDASERILVVTSRATLAANRQKKENAAKGL